MLNSVKAWVNLHNWQLDRQLTVLAVSGGMDSVALFYSFLELDFPFIVAHVNFGLRGEESDGDEDFVKTLCARNNVECFVKKVDPMHWKSLQTNSIQMEARNIRYEFFEQIRTKKNASLIATAHHAQDNLENFFIYLFRDQLGTAWKGISFQNGCIIRPLLNSSRHEISEYLSHRNADFRLDSSNDSNKYLRNKVRHAIIDQLDDLKSFQSDFLEINRQFSKLIQKEQDAFNLKWNKKVRKESFRNLLVISKSDWEYSDKQLLTQKFYRYGFTEQQVKDAFLKEHKNGSFWEGKSGYLLIQQSNHELLLGSFSSITNPIELTMNQLPMTVLFGNFQIQISQCDSLGDEGNNNGCFIYAINDREPINLIVRAYKPGDKIRLSGMGGHKKVSDLLNENRIPAVLKNQYPIIEFNGIPIGVVSVRKGDFVAENANSYLRIDWKLTTQTD